MGPEVPSGVPWKDAGPDLIAEFEKAYQVIAYEEGLLEKSLLFSEMQEESEVGTKYEDFAGFNANRQAEAGMPCAPEFQFQGLVYSGDLHAGSMLSREVEEYCDWEEHRDEEGYEFPSDHMRLAPLEFPPEMWIHELGGGAISLEVGSPIAMEASRLRDGAVYQQALLKQERYLCTSAMILAAHRTGISIPRHEIDEALTEISSYYSSLTTDQSQLTTGFVFDISDLVERELARLQLSQ